MIENYIKALRKGDGYDWISNFGHELKKDELIRIIKELDYAIYSNNDMHEAMEIYDSAACELEDYYND